MGGNNYDVQSSSQIVTNKPTPGFLQADALPVTNQQCQSTEGKEN